MNINNSFILFLFQFIYFGDWGLGIGDWGLGKLSSFINDCVNIEKNIKNIEEINNSIKNFNNHSNQKISFRPKDNEELKEFLETIKKFGKLRQNICL